MMIADVTIKPVRFKTTYKMYPLVGGSFEVTAESPISCRKVVYQLARNFRREFRYDFTQYGHDGRENDPDHRAYVWTETMYTQTGGGEDYAVGACCFRLRSASDWRDPPTWAGDRYWALQWAWFHPYFRRHGILSRAWPEFVKRYGEFDVEGPLSIGMWAFVNRNARWVVDRMHPENVAFYNRPFTGK